MKNTRFSLSLVMTLLAAVCFMPTMQANPYYYGGNGWGGYRGGYGGYHGGCGYGGWYGTGIPNGLGWTLAGLGAAGVMAAVATPFVTQPVYAVPAAPVYVQGPPQVAVAQQSAPRVNHSSGTLAKAQSKLAGLGYYKGDVDGSYGPQTVQAVQQFQAENNLPVSGRLDLKTLSSLGIIL